MPDYNPEQKEAIKQLSFALATGDYTLFLQYYKTSISENDFMEMCRHSGYDALKQTSDRVLSKLLPDHSDVEQMKPEIIINCNKDWQEPNAEDILKEGNGGQS